MEWSTLIPTIVGGLIAATSSVCMFGLAQRKAHQIRERERKTERAEAALMGLEKLTKTANSIGNLKAYINKELAKEDPDNPAEFRAQLIHPTVNLPREIVDVSAFEMSFLAQKNTTLITKIWEVQYQARNIEYGFSEYNRRRFGFNEFIEDNGQELRVGKGYTVDYQLPDQLSPVGNLRQQQLDLMILGIKAALEKYEPTIDRIIQKYVEIAFDEFGEEFPVTRIVKGVK